MKATGLVGRLAWWGPPGWCPREAGALQGWRSLCLEAGAPEAGLPQYPASLRLASFQEASETLTWVVWFAVPAGFSQEKTGSL